MAEISKLSGVAIADVAKVDAVTKANIANINDLTIPSGVVVTPPLDTYTGAAAGYSVRLLRTAYTGACMRVRRDSDNTEQDIGFDSNGDLDTAAIATFVGSGNNGYVRYWYDQSGNANDAGQATAASQPQIYNGTAVNTENGKPAVYFDTDYLLNSSVTNVSGLAQSWFWVSEQDINLSSNILVSCGIQSTGKSRTFTSEYYMRFVASTQNYSGYAETNVQRLHAIVCPGTISNISAYDWYRDGSLLTPTTSSTSAVNSISGTSVIGLGRHSGTEGYTLQGQIQEAILYNSDQSSNRSGIETNINDYFSIY